MKVCEIQQYQRGWKSEAYSGFLETKKATQLNNETVLNVLILQYDTRIETSQCIYTSTLSVNCGLETVISCFVFKYTPRAYCTMNEKFSVLEKAKLSVVL